MVTQFEALTAAAYHELARQEVEVAVVEAGLGGRYDATNVIPSRVQVLTGIDLEHTRWLGPRIEDIAEEKLAVVRDGATLVAPPDLDPAAAAVAERVARERGARLVLAPPADDAGVDLRAAGGFQRGNFALAAAAAEAFLGRALDPAAVAAAGARDARGGPDGRGRPGPAHDLRRRAQPVRASDALAASLDDVLGGRRPRVAVIGVLEDKDAAAMLRALLPRFDHVVFTRSGATRARSRRPPS